MLKIADNPYFPYCANNEIHQYFQNNLPKCIEYSCLNSAARDDDAPNSDTAMRCKKNYHSHIFIYVQEPIT
jgi:hypothetical protein